MGSDGIPVDRQELIFGLKSFRAEGDKFTINGEKTFLRGKHDGLIFPLTGYAPTDVEEWVRILGISKSYGINHYRFHTCCPPEARSPLRICSESICSRSCRSGERSQ